MKKTIRLTESELKHIIRERIDELGRRSIFKSGTSPCIQLDSLCDIISECNWWLPVVPKFEVYGDVLYCNIVPEMQDIVKIFWKKGGMTSNMFLSQCTKIWKEILLNSLKEICPDKDFSISDSSKRFSNYWTHRVFYLKVPIVSKNESVVYDDRFNGKFKGDRFMEKVYAYMLEKVRENSEHSLDESISRAIRKYLR